jgi:RNA polymerase sigma-70 factor (TIGR02960 family)
MDTGAIEKWALPDRPIPPFSGVDTDGGVMTPGCRWCEGGPVSVELMWAARNGDGQAFADLVQPHRRELHVHCYRVLGSVADADDALQETLLAAWRAFPRFEERSSLRTWLYRIATSRCMNMLRSAGRRPEAALPADVHPPAPTRLGEVTWLEPYPDVLLEEMADRAPGPEARLEAKEAISLAFVTALQLLPPRQRAVLVLRDVLDFSAREVAEMLDATEQAVASALKRARATIAAHLPRPDLLPPSPGSAEEQAVQAKLTAAFEAADVDAMIALLTEGAWLRMPPVPLEYQGRELVGHFFATVAFRHGRRYRLVPTRANGQPALAFYLRDPHSPIAHAFGLLLFTLSGDRVSAITRFDNAALPSFGLPRTLTD